ncbi:MAG: VOC family protein [Flammeovirgaceae bacterium]|nr:VOC family protein [Flammeovirgaceae bacterium]
MRRIILVIVGVFIAIIALLVTSETHAQDSHIKNSRPMIYQDIYPVFITRDLTSSKDFYTRWFNLQVAFESSFFILLISTGERPWSVGFLNESHPSSPPSNPAMNAQAGVYLTLQVEDAKSDFEKLKAAGLKISYALKDEPWGQRRFGVVDPNGMYVDVVQQIEPANGFWDKYMTDN